MSLTSSGKQDTLTVPLDLDMRPWLVEKARKQSIRPSTFVRQLVRAAMDAEQKQADGAAA